MKHLLDSLGITPPPKRIPGGYQPTPRAVTEMELRRHMSGLRSDAARTNSMSPTPQGGPTVYYGSVNIIPGEGKTTEEAYKELIHLMIDDIPSESLARIFEIHTGYGRGSGHFRDDPDANEIELRVRCTI